MNSFYDFTPNMDLISRKSLSDKFKAWIKDIEEKEDGNTWWTERDAVESCLAEVEDAPAIVIPHWVKFSERRPPKKDREYLVAYRSWSKEYSLELACYAPVKDFENETDVTTKRDYNDDWAFGRYNENIDLIGMPDKWIGYWLEGIRIPRGREQ